MNPLAFLLLLTTAEQQQPAILTWLLRQLQGDTLVNIPFRELTAGLSTLVANGTITQTRANQITTLLQSNKPAVLTVASSTVNVDAAQKDGRFWAYEHHTLSDGTKREFSTLHPAGTNATTVMTARATAMNAQFAADSAAS